MLRTACTLLLLLLPALPAAAAPSQRLEEDLDGDGRKEAITLEAVAEGRYVPLEGVRHFVRGTSYGFRAGLCT